MKDSLPKTRGFLRAFCALLCVCLPLCACSTPETEQDERLRVVCALFAPYDFVREIAGDSVKLTLLLPPGVESHRFEPSPADIILLQDCDLFIRVDASMELWSQPILDSLEKRPRVLTLSDAIGVVVAEEHEHEHSQEDAHEVHGADPHLWTNPLYARKMVMEIAAVLQQLDSANAAVYAQNAERYAQQLEELDQDIQSIVDKAQRRLLVFGSSFAMKNFTERYGLEVLAAFDSCGEHAEPSARVVADMTKKLRGLHIPVVLKQEIVSGRVAQSIAEESAAQVLELHSCHNVTKQDFRAGAGYLSLMRRNLKVLETALA